MRKHRRAAWLGALLVAGGALAAPAGPARSPVPKVATPVYLGFLGQGEGTLTQTKPGTGTPAVAHIGVQWLVGWHLRPGGGERTLDSRAQEIHGIASQRGPRVRSCAGAVSANAIPLPLQTRPAQKVALAMPITIGLTTVTCYSDGGTLWFAPGVGKNVAQRRYFDDKLNYAVGPLRAGYAPQRGDAQALPRNGIWSGTRTDPNGNVARLTLRWQGTFLAGYGGTGHAVPADRAALATLLQRLEPALANPRSKLRQHGLQRVRLPAGRDRGVLVVAADAGRARLAQGATAIGARRPGSFALRRTASGAGVLARPLPAPLTVTLTARLLLGNDTLRVVRRVRLAR